MCSGGEQGHRVAGDVEREHHRHLNRIAQHITVSEMVKRWMGRVGIGERGLERTSRATPMWKRQPARKSASSASSPPQSAAGSAPSSKASPAALRALRSRGLASTSLTIHHCFTQMGSTRKWGLRGALSVNHSVRVAGESQAAAPLTRTLFRPGAPSWCATTTRSTPDRAGPGGSTIAAEV